MGRALWIIIGLVLLDFIGAPFIFGGSPVIASYLVKFLGDDMTTVIVMMAALYGISFGLLRAIRGPERVEGSMVIGVILAASFIGSGLMGYPGLYDSIIVPFKQNPYLYGGILVFLLIASKGFRKLIGWTWRKSKGEPKPEKEKKAKGRWKLGWFGEARIRIWKKIQAKAKRVRWIGRLLKTVGKRYSSPPGELHFMLKDLRIELYTLLNYMLRDEIWRAKHAALTKRKDEVQQKEGHMQQKVEETEEFLRDALRKSVEGGEIELFRGTDGFTDFKLKPEGLYGVARKSILIYDLMKKLRDALQADLRSNAHPIITARNFVEDEKKLIENLVQKKKKEEEGGQDGKLTLAIDRYKSTIMRFKVLNYVRAYRLWFMDMYNFQGEYKRGFNFAKKGAVPFIYVVKAEGNGVQRKIDWGTSAPAGIGGAGKTGVATDYEPETSEPNRLVEVNLFGYAVRDINAIQIEQKNAEAFTPQHFPSMLLLLPKGEYYIRKYKKEDIVWFFDEKAGRFGKTLTQSEFDWGYGVEDMNKGRHHLYSKSTVDYDPVIESGSLNFDNVEFRRLLPYNYTAYDREALKDPGKLVYWGRKYYDDETADNPRIRAPANPYPTVSMLGLWDFISRVAQKHEEDVLGVRTYLNNYWKMRYEQLPAASAQAGTQATTQPGGQTP